MSFQIAKIAIYGPNLEIRELNFRLGAVNIVTGDSATGKTSLFHIINYCLGAKDCRIPHGPIRKCVLWYGLLLQFSDYQMFVARKAPDPGSAISEAFHVKVGKQVRIPAFEELGPTDTTATVMSSLASHIRIAENLTEPEASRTSDPIEASFRHALAFCLQHQNDLSSDTHIFQGTQNHFKLLALRDCLPYFLGAMETDRLKEQARLRELRTQLRKLLRQQKAGEDSNEAALLDATGLLSEAAEVGLIPGMPVMPSLREALDELSRAVCYRLASETDLASQISPEFQRQQRERASLIRQLHQTDDKIDELSEFVSEQDAYTHVLQEERSRLRPVNALLDFDCSECPLCGEALSSTVPAVVEIRKSLGVLEAQLSGVNKDRPHLSSRIERLKAEREFIKERLRTNRSTLETLRGLDEELRSFGEIESARMKVVGRIAYFLEKLVLIEDGLASKIALVQKQVNGLEKKLDSGALEDLVDSKLSIIAEWMTSMARELSLEHSETRVRLDRKKLMVVADTRDGPVSLSEIGSGHNWMGYHVVTYLAMHRWFCEESRPIPRFAFFDQPSTAFYQNEEGDVENPGDLSQSDRVALQGVFALMFREVARLEGRIQLIVIDHADLPGDDFRGAVVERWRRDGLKLVPDAWLEFVTEEATIDEPLSE